MLDLTTAALVAAWSAAPLYGLNVFLAAACISALAKKGGLVGRNWALALVIGAQFVLSTGHAVSLLYQAFRGLINPPSLPSSNSDAWQSLPPDVSPTAAYFQDQSSPEHTVEVSLYIFNSLVADCFMTWRVYVVWDRQSVLTAPFILLNVVTLVFSVLVVQNNTIVNFNLLKYFGGSGRHRIIAVWAISIATQTAGTLLIAYRQLSTPVYVTSTRNIRRCNLANAACVIIDSGVIYTAGIMVTLACYLHKLGEGAVIVAVVGQIAATVPLSIIMREWWKSKKIDTSQARFLPRSVLFQNHSVAAERHPSRSNLNSSQGHNEIGVNIMKSTYIQSDANSNPLSDGESEQYDVGGRLVT